MVHTLPDYTTKYKLTTIFSQLDTGELAARLDSINTYDRRGNVIWYDDFESTTLKWASSTDGAGAAVAVSTTAARNGSSSVKLTGGSDDGRFAAITKHLQLPVFKRIGLETSFTLDENVDFLQLSLTTLKSGVYATGILKVSLSDDKIYFYNSAEAWEAILTGLSLRKFTDLFYTVKLVVDWENLKYIRALFENQEVDLSDEDLPRPDAPIGDKVWVQIYICSLPGVNGISYIDDFIYTQNEP